MNGLLLLLLQDETAQVGLDLLQLLFGQRLGLVQLVLRLVLLLQPPLVPLNLCKCGNFNLYFFLNCQKMTSQHSASFECVWPRWWVNSGGAAACAVVTHGGQRGRTGPVLRLDLGWLVGVRGLSRWKLGRLNDSFDVFVYIWGAGEVGPASAGREVNSDQPN